MKKDIVEQGREDFEKAWAIAPISEQFKTELMKTIAYGMFIQGISTGLNRAKELVMPVLTP